MNDAIIQKFATIPADATPETLQQVLGSPEPVADPTTEQAAQLETFGVAATDLQRINLELVESATGRRFFWNADDVLSGVLEHELHGSTLVPADFAPALAKAARALLDAADSRANEVLTLVDAPLPAPETGVLVLEWLVAHERGVEETLLADVAGPLAAEIKALCDVLAAAGESVHGRLLLRTFDADV